MLSTTISVLEGLTNSIPPFFETKFFRKFHWYRAFVPLMGLAHVLDVNRHLSHSRTFVS